MKNTRTIKWTLLLAIAFPIISCCTKSADVILEEYDEYFLKAGFEMPIYQYEVQEFKREGSIDLESSYYKLVYVSIFDSVSDDCMKEGYIWKYLFTDLTKSTIDNLESTKEHIQKIAEGHIQYLSRIDSLEYLATIGVFDRDYRYLFKGKYYR